MQCVSLMDPSIVLARTTSRRQYENPHRLLLFCKALPSCYRVASKLSTRMGFALSHAHAQSMAIFLASRHVQGCPKWGNFLSRVFTINSYLSLLVASPGRRFVYFKLPFSCSIAHRHTRQKTNWPSQVFGRIVYLLPPLQWPTTCPHTQAYGFLTEPALRETKLVSLSLDCHCSLYQTSTFLLLQLVEPNKDIQPLYFPQTWTRPLDGMYEPKERTILVKGQKNTGKSTFARSLLNRLLSR